MKLFKEMSTYSRDYGDKLLIYYLKEEDSGDYECFLNNQVLNRIRLTVKSSNNEYNINLYPPQENYNQQRQHENRNEETYDNRNNHNRQASYHAQNSQHEEPRRTREPIVHLLEKEVDQNVEIDCGLDTENEFEIKWRKRNDVSIQFE